MLFDRLTFEDATKIVDMFLEGVKHDLGIEVIVTDPLKYLDGWIFWISTNPRYRATDLEDMLYDNVKIKFENIGIHLCGGTDSNGNLTGNHMVEIVDFR